MIKIPSEATQEAIDRIRGVSEFKTILNYIRSHAMHNYQQLPQQRGENTLIAQGELATLCALFKHLSGKDVFDGPA